jgi:hypothetical protein
MLPGDSRLDSATTNSGSSTAAGRASGGGGIQGPPSQELAHPVGGVAHRYLLESALGPLVTAVGRSDELEGFVNLDTRIGNWQLLSVEEAPSLAYRHGTMPGAASHNPPSHNQNPGAPGISDPLGEGIGDREIPC